MSDTLLCTKQAARLAATQLAAGGDNALTKKQVKRALVMAGKRRVAFPGFNAPLPSNADVAAWAAKEGGGKVAQVMHWGSEVKTTITSKTFTERGKDLPRYVFAGSEPAPCSTVQALSQCH